MTKACEINTKNQARGGTLSAKKTQNLQAELVNTGNSSFKGSKD
jgi:hypothetical protein